MRVSPSDFLKKLQRASLKKSVLTILKNTLSEYEQHMMLLENTQFILVSENASSDNQVVDLIPFAVYLLRMCILLILVYA